MSLTDDDLQAIKGIVDTAVDGLAVQTAQGFTEVHEKFTKVDEKFTEVHDKFTEVHDKFAEIHEKIDGLAEDMGAVKDAVGRIENIQRAEVERMDRNDVDISKLKQQLNMA